MAHLGVAFPIDLFQLFNFNTLRLYQECMNNFWVYTCPLN